MSNFYFKAKNPKTGEFGKATFIDNYFGAHQYGVLFDEDGKVYREDEIEQPMQGEEIPMQTYASKTIKDRVEEIKKEFDREFPALNNIVEKQGEFCGFSIVTSPREFLSESLTKLAKEVADELDNELDLLKDDESLQDEANGRYNREMELREKIQHLKSKRKDLNL